MKLCLPVLFVLSSLLLAPGCASSPKYIANTKVVDTTENKQILTTLEKYRTALEERDATKLLMLASDRYWEDAGTPTGEDDYGYEKLKDVLTVRLSRASEIRYSLRYKRIRLNAGKAFVDVLIDASFTITDADGNSVRRDMRDRNQFVLVQDGEDWKFLSGM